MLTPDAETDRRGRATRERFYSSVMANNTLKVEDSDGDELAHDDYGIVPGVSATWSARF